ncbi:hypothetical protein T3H97_10630 [Paenibacillus sp. LX16]|uniref:hypothetical protein n=1 Tax=Paenibacillus sp. LX16 TaxID=1740264 RepID=UPI0019FB1203|nr:hypothetical protein [Paenibacillus sp. LX16]KAF6637744.1 hypothetical protein H6F38_02570 [Paenibacillus sp. EKM208P]
MAFGITRQELMAWKRKVSHGEIAFLTHYWLDDRFPGITTVTKVGCSDLDKLRLWCNQNGLDPQYIHQRQPYPHFDLIGNKQAEILRKYGISDQFKRFELQLPTSIRPSF